MADKLEKSYKVDINFVAGESPTPAKLNAWSRQISSALTLVEKALGDVYDQSYPYFDTASKLSSAPLRTYNATFLPSPGRKLEIANLARLIGPSSALNPIHLSGLSVAERTITEVLTSSKVNFVKYPITNSQPVTFNNDTANAFTTEQANPADVTLTGHYYIDYNLGMIVSFTTPGALTEIEYVADLNPGWHIADPFGMTFNVIPDQNQSTKCTCTGPDGNGLYTITLPVLTDTIMNDEGDGDTIVNDDDLGHGAQLDLPRVLIVACSTGDEIPSGFLYVRDETTQQIYRDAVYYYENEYTIKVGGVTLDTAAGFTVITVGSSITHNIAFLKMKMIQLQRGEITSMRLSASQLIDIYGEGPLTGDMYVPSEADLNPFSQYLHRDGWFSDGTDSGLNDQNGLKGHLVILSTTKSGYTRNHLGSDSFKLIFGSYNNGPYIKYTADFSKHLDLVGSSSGVTDGAVRVVNTNFICEEGIYSGSSDFDNNHGPLKWYIHEEALAPTPGFGFLTTIPALGGKKILSVNGSVLDPVSGYRFSSGDQGVFADMRLQGFYDPVTDECGLLYAAAGWGAGAHSVKLIIMYMD